MISLGIDIGGTGCKCVAFSDQGQQLALSYEEYPLPAGTVNLPPQILTESVFRVIRDCAKKLENAADIAAITVSSFGESFVVVDKDGNALDDIRMYFGNSESAAFDALVEKVGAERFMDICRILPDSSYSLAKMLYTMEIAPSIAMDTSCLVEIFLLLLAIVTYLHFLFRTLPTSLKLKEA